jgi:hypothetical protein
MLEPGCAITLAIWEICLLFVRVHILVEPAITRTACHIYSKVLTTTGWHRACAVPSITGGCE